ncbi:assimilatory sulfite reductase (NADPH) hemoprotein subunit [Motilimonas eburnea]|uniref:assimilatory sulfite reductase (NADPH) hemoprotein subunit n=1 Tax=Motilimonas eburnea TaxID=1737488 RepID=UPI001E4C24D7|nr:assimilatory sulfite reductase (NADPH) hemoprotein subunit [Motilimonas eburnea]MCE2570834.1 assimilatory sulfite reductase (NADPH) hemoprotein subunit [Motilimonas eburnea]
MSYEPKPSPDNSLDGRALSDNERIKTESNFLRGTIAEALDDQVYGGFSPDDIQLIKFHGLYQQDDRDLRGERKKQKLDPRHSFLLRARMPGGICTPEQWLQIDKYAQERTMVGSIRLTTRQTFQYHGILKRNLRPIFQGLDEVGIDSIFTAGDVNRNTLCTSNPVESEFHAEMYELAKQTSEHFLPNTKGFADLWLNGEKVASNEAESEPLYSNVYLPRKFKIAFVMPPQNDIDVHANDISFVAIVRDGELIGYNVLVGAGLGHTHGDKRTHPRKADDFGFIAKKDVIAIAEAIVTVQRDWGNRCDRHLSKTKYTIERVGVEAFKGEVEGRSGIQFAPSEDYKFEYRGDRIGWIKGIDNKWHLTLFIENGRILDFPGKPLKTGMREIAKVHKGDFRLTANQNLIIAGVAEEDKAQIEQLAVEHGLKTEELSKQRENSMACVSFPTCPLAMAEAERYLPGLVTEVEAMLDKYGVADEHLVLRVTGCPNGCGRAALAEFGLVGKGPGKYNILLGGNREGTRIPKMYIENADEAQILDELDGLIGRWATERLPNEGFGDFTIRAGIVEEVVIASRDFYA